MKKILESLTRVEEAYFPKKGGLYGDYECVKVKVFRQKVLASHNTIWQIFNSVYGREYSSDETAKMLIDRFYENSRMLDFVIYTDASSQEVIEVYFDDLLSFRNADARYPKWKELNDFLRQIPVLSRNKKR